MIKPKLCKPSLFNKGSSRNEQEPKCWNPYPICICYASQEKQPIPLQNVHYYLNIQPGIVIVEVQQEYSTQGFENPIGLEYLFLINKKAAVTKMVVEIGNEKKYGIVKEKEEAEKEYEEGIQQGKTMAYSDQDGQFPEIKKVKVGSLAPNKNLKIIFEYVQPLEVFLNKYWKVQVSPLVDPFYLNESYKNQSNYYNKLFDAIGSYVLISKYIINYQQNISVQINNRFVITSIKSPTHKIISTQAKDLAKQNILQNQFQNYTLELEDIPENYQPNKQFILLFSTDDINLPRAILTHTNNDSLTHQKYCATITFTPKFNEVSLDDAYQQYLDGINIVYDQKVNRGNYLFFLDRSGSMDGRRIEKAKNALIVFLKSLPEDSSFNIISFGSQYQKFWDESQQYCQKSLDDALTFVQNLQADMGGTEIFKPLKEIVYNQDSINEYKTLQMTQNVFLLTDGEVNAQPIIDLIQQNSCSEIRIYTLGIGEDCSKLLIKQAAQVGNGKYHIMSDYEDINAKVIDLLEDSLTTYLKAFVLETSAMNISQIIPAPDSIVSLKKNQELMIQILFSNEQLNNNVEFNLSCYDPQEQKPIKYDIALNIEQSQNNDYFHKIAAHKFITCIEDSLQQQDYILNCVDYFQNSIQKTDLINISIQHQILSSDTAFVCEVCELEDQFEQQISQKVVINKIIKKDKQYFDSYEASYNSQNLNTNCMYSECYDLKDSEDEDEELEDRSSENLEQQDQNDQEICYEIKQSQQWEEVEVVRGENLENQNQKDQEICYEMKESHQHEALIQISQQQEGEYINKTKDIQEAISYESIIQFSQANGRFILSTNYQNILKIEQFKKMYQLKEEVLQTLLSLFYLELFFVENKLSWQLIFSKGVSFLQQNAIKYREVKIQFLEKYKQLLIE